MDSTAIIRELNDAFRTAPAARVYVTRGIASLPPEQQAEIMRRVHGFDAFTEGNDPHGEHDFGSFEYAGKTILTRPLLKAARREGLYGDLGDDLVVVRQRILIPPFHPQCPATPRGQNPAWPEWSACLPLVNHS